MTSGTIVPPRIDTEIFNEGAGAHKIDDGVKEIQPHNKAKARKYEQVLSSSDEEESDFGFDSDSLNSEAEN